MTKTGIGIALPQGDRTRARGNGTARAHVPQISTPRSAVCQLILGQGVRMGARCV